MKVFGHDDISVDDEAVPATGLFKDIEEPISTFRCTHDGLTSVAAAGDEMEMLGAVVAMKISRHRTRVEGIGRLDRDRALGQFVMKKRTHPAL